MQCVFDEWEEKRGPCELFPMERGKTDGGLSHYYSKNSLYLLSGTIYGSYITVQRVPTRRPRRITDNSRLPVVE